MDVTQTPEIVVLIYAGTEVEDLHDTLAEPDRRYDEAAWTVYEQSN